MKPFLSVVFSARDENILFTLINADRELSEAFCSYEILVMGDVKKEVQRSLKKFTRAIENIRFLDSDTDRVIQDGIVSARGRWRAFCDPKHASSLSTFENIIPQIKGESLIFGSQKPRGEEGFLGNLFEKIKKFLLKNILRSDIQDPSPGFLCFSEEIAEEIFPLNHISDEMFGFEIFALAQERNIKIKEAPVFEKKNRTSPKLFWEMIRFRFFRSRTRGFKTDILDI